MQGSLASLATLTFVPSHQVTNKTHSPKDGSQGRDGEVGEEQGGILVLSQQRATNQQLRIPKLQHKLQRIPFVGSVLLKRQAHTAPTDRPTHMDGSSFTKPWRLDISGFSLTSCSCSPSSAW